MERCPNLKPAFLTLRDAGYTNLRVLLLPHDFNTDWIEKGYAVEKRKVAFRAWRIADFVRATRLI